MLGYGAYFDTQIPLSEEKAVTLIPHKRFRIYNASTLRFYFNSISIKVSFSRAHHSLNRHPITA